MSSAAFNISTLMGPCLAGTYIASVLYGITLLQKYQYFNKYWRSDRRYIRVLVGVLTALNSLAIVMIMDVIWVVLIRGKYNDPTHVLTVDWRLMTAVMVTAIIAFIVQMFYSYRLWILSEKNPWLPGVIMVISLAALAFSFAYMACVYRHTDVPMYLYIPSVLYLSTTALSCSLAADFFIASSMIFYLMKGRQVGLKRTDTMINKLIIYTINSGLLTMICSGMALTMSEVYPRAFYNTIFYFALSTCYVMSMLAVLNTRESLRGSDVVSVQFNTVPGANTQSGGGYPTPQNTSGPPSDGVASMKFTEPVASTHSSV